MTYYYLAALAVAVVLVFLRTMRAGLRTEEAQQAWVPGWAEVLEVEEQPTSPNWIGEGGMVGLFAVRARLRTRDGREAVGWADGGYPRTVVRSWLGRTVEAWHDPQDPSRFRLHPPQSARQARTSLVGPVLFLVVVVGIVTAVLVLVS